MSTLLLLDLARDTQLDESLYDAVVEQLKLPNGTWRLTGRGRLARVDERLLSLLIDEYTRGEELRVLDVGASTGVTSVELYRRLSVYFNVQLTATDLYRDVILVRAHRGRHAVIFTPEGDPIQHVVGPFVLPAQFKESWAYPVNHLLRGWSSYVFRTRWLPQVGHLNPAELPPFEFVRCGEIEVARIPLLSRSCLELLNHTVSFRFELADILKPMPYRAQVVRAMNILTAEHFPEDRRAVALRNCITACVEGGFFVVGWSPTIRPDDVMASIYRVKDGRLRHLEAINGGSEIDEFIARRCS